MTPGQFDVFESNNTPVQEAFRALRTNILFCGVDKKIKTMAVTSCNPGEGKSTIAFNLAASLARTGIKVLIADADLRKPTIWKLFSGQCISGLSNVITGFAELGDVIQSTAVENLFFLSCGPTPPNPTELITSSKFSEVLQALKEKFDLVVLDTPPLGSVIDGAVIAALVDGTLLVLEPKAVKYNHALKVKEQLEKANARILGVVLNKIKKGDYKSYHYISDYYGKTQKIPRSWFRKRNKRLEGMV